MRKIFPIAILKVLIFLAIVCLPLFTLYLRISFPAKPFRDIFTAFILLHSFVRVWETFYTSKEKQSLTLTEDWTLAIGTANYILFCFFIVIEFFFRARAINFLTCFSGVIIYSCGFALRRWGRIALGRQWAIHAVGEKKIDKVRLIRLGPYKYIRHPIYAGILLDEVGLPLIAGCFLSLCYAFLTCIPLLLLRVYYEERTSSEKFDSGYDQYKREVGSFLPFRSFKYLRSKKGEQGS